MLSSKTVTFFTEENPPYTTFSSHIFWGMTLAARFSVATGFWDYRKFLNMITLLRFLQIVPLPEELCYFCAGDFSTLCQWVLEIFPHTWPCVNGFLMASASRIAKAQKTTSPQSNDTISSTADVLWSLRLSACPNTELNYNTTQLNYSRTPFFKSSGGEKKYKSSVRMKWGLWAYEHLGPHRSKAAGQLQCQAGVNFSPIKDHLKKINIWVQSVPRKQWRPNH